MLTAAKAGTFSTSSDPCALFPLAASGVYPKTRVWGSEPENLHCFSATAPLKVELRWGCEESSEKTAVKRKRLRRAGVSCSGRLANHIPSLNAEVLGSGQQMCIIRIDDTKARLSRSR